MDDSQNQQQSNPVSILGQDPTGQVVQSSTVQQPVQQDGILPGVLQVPPISFQQPAPTPISVPHKEQAVSSAPSNSEAAPLIIPTEQEPVISQEVAPIIERISEEPKITEAHKQIGLELAKESVPVSTQPTGLVHIPWPAEEVQKIKRTTATNDSKHWLAILFERVLKQLGNTAQKTAHV